MNHLLDVIADNANLIYLSDLHDDNYRSSVVSALQSISPENYQLQDWQEAYTYITKTSPAPFCQPTQLRDALIPSLSP